MDRGARASFLALSLLACGCSGAFSGASGELEGEARGTSVSRVDASDPDALVAAALGADPESEAFAASVDALRQRGPDQLDALIERYAELAPTGEDDARWRGLIDAVAQQRDAVYGGLFWERDLDRARQRARAEGKAILSLRLLGELDTEFSCANSRLFRTLLYADPELAAWLETHFVLHWSSERPVPRVAIDFGDGRVVHRTITGNSAHFVLDADGRTLDVLPGLWAPPRFRAALEQSLELVGALDGRSLDADATAVLAAHHERRFEAAAVDLSAKLTMLRGAPVDVRDARLWLAQAPGDEDGDGRVPAKIAVPMAVGKSRMEAPILDAAPRQLGMRGPAEPAKAPSLLVVALDLGPGFEPMTDAERVILGVGLSRYDDLHPNTLAILSAERPVDGLVEGARERAELESRMAAGLLTSVHEDTAKNALELYPRVHAELARRARAGEPLDFESVDAWLYAELFQTPAGDPWLGLVDPEVYTGLVRGGVSAKG